MMTRRLIGIVILLFLFSLQVHGGESYSIQMGLYNHEPTANAFFQDLLQKDLPVYRIINTSHRIFYGLYGSKTEAMRDLEEARKFVRGAFVVKLNSEQQKAIHMMKEEVVEEVRDVEESPFLIEERIRIPLRDDRDTIRVYNYNFMRDIVFHGFHGISSVFTKVYDEWTLLEGGFIRILYSHSIPEKYYGSSLTILLNNTPIYSTLFSSREQRVNELIIPVEPGMFQKGFNEIKISTYHRLTDDPCEDDQNPALWVIIHKNSFIHLRYEERQISHFTKDYPYPYVKEYLDEAIQFAFILDEEIIDSHSIKALLLLATNIGQRVKYKQLEFSVKGYDALKEMEGHFILLDTRIPPLLEPFFPKDFILEENKIYIGEKTIGHRKVLCLLAMDSRDLVKAAKVLTNDTMIRQIPHILNIPVEDVDYVESFVYQSEYHSLKDLGYEHQLLQGGRVVNADYFISYPKNWSIEEGAHFALKTRYSQALIFQNSTVTILVNGIPIGNTLLTEEGATESIHVYYLPKEVLKDRAFHLQIQFFLDGDIDCRSSSDYRFLWAYISNESHFYLPYREKVYFDFKDFPSPFISDFYLQDFHIILDPGLSLEEIALSANIMAFMGNHLRGLGDFNVLLGEETFKGNSILLGTTEKPLIRAINEDLLIPYSDSFRFFTRSRHLLLEEEANQLSTAQLVVKKDSPYAHLFLSGFTIDSLQWIARFFYDYELHDRLDGNVAFVNNRGFLNTLHIGDRPREGLRVMEEITTRREFPLARATFEEIRNYLILSGLVIIGIILFIIFYQRRESLK